MKGKMPYQEAFAMAYALRAELAPYCERIEIAGSVRRRKAEIGDIELVAIPKLLPARVDLFGNEQRAISMLDEAMRGKYAVLKGGEKYQQILLPGGMVCDLFLQTAETWGVNFTIRTGSADFAHWLVTERRMGGAKPGYLTIRDARVWNGEEVVPTPEEEDFFRALGVRWVEPEERTQGFWKRGEAQKIFLNGPVRTSLKNGETVYWETEWKEK